MRINAAHADQGVAILSLTPFHTVDEATLASELARVFVFWYSGLDLLHPRL